MKDAKKMLEKNKIEKYNLISLPTIDLPPEEAKRFIDCIVDESVMKDYARIERMSKPTKRIRHLGFGDGHFLYPATHFDESDYKKQWSHNLILLTAQKFRGCAPVYDDDLEEGLEGAAYKAHLMSIIAKQTANELEYALYMADAQSYNTWCDDRIEGTFDGWRYIINNSQSGDNYYNSVCGGAHIKSACLCESGTACGSGHEDPGAHFELSGKIAEQSAVAPYNLEIKYGMMLKNMPSKYKANTGLKNMVFLNSDLVTQDYLMALEARGTALGDRAITDGDVTRYHKVPIIDVPLMPTALGTAPDYGIVGAGAYTDVVLTPKNNLIIGIQKDIKIEPMRSAADECTYYFYTMKIAAAIENVNAVVFLKCLEHKC
jgi:hypothetical protein